MEDSTSSELMDEATKDPDQVVIDDLENLVVQQEKYKRKMLEVSSCYNAIQ